MAEPTKPEAYVPPQTQEEHNQDTLDMLSDPEIQQLYQEAFPEKDDPASSPEQLPTTTSADPDEVDQTGFWQSMAPQIATKVLSGGIPGTIGEPLVKGGLKGVAAGLDTATSAATAISAETGLYKLGRSEEEQSAFLKWYNTPSSQKGPADYRGVQVSQLDKKVDEWMGPSRGGVSGFVEGAAQFSVGMAGASRMLGSGVGGLGVGVLEGSGALAAGERALLAVDSGLSALPKVGKYIPAVGKYVAGSLGTVLKGAITDAAFFNPWEKKLADLVESGPDFLSNPVTRYLQSDIKDSEAEARFKRSLEGVMLGVAADGFLQGLRVIKVRLGYKSGVLSKEEAGKLMEEAGNALESPPAADDLARVIETGDGRYAVEGVEDAGFKTTDILSPMPQPKKGVPPIQQYGYDPKAAPKPDNMVTKVLDENAIKQEQAATDAFGPEPKPVEAPPAPAVPSKKRMVFSNVSDAQSVAATVNYAMKNRSLPPAVATKQSVEAWQKMKMHFGDKLPDAKEMSEFLEDNGFAIRYAQKPEEILATVRSLVDDVAEPVSSSAARSPRTHEEMLSAARDLLPGTTPEEALGMAQRVFGATQKLPEQMLALRAVMWSHGRALRRLSQLVESSPNNKLAMDQLASGLDTLMELHANITGASSNTARALNVHGVSQGRVIEKLGDPGLVAAEEGKTVVLGPKKGPGSPASAPEAPGPSLPTAADNAAPEATQVVQNADVLKAQADSADAAAMAQSTQDVGVVGNKATAGEGTSVMSPTPKQKPGAPAPAIAADAAKAEPTPGSPTVLPPQQAGQGVLPQGDAGGFQTLQGLKSEMKSWERLLADLKSRPDRAANQGAISEAAKKIGEISGKMMEIQKALPKQPKYLAPMGRRATEGLTMDQIKSLARNVFMADGDPAAILWALRGSQIQRMANKVADRTLARKMYDWAANAHVESMLSAPPTFTSNIVSNMQVMLMRPAEYWMAGWMPNRMGSWNPGKWRWAEHPELRQEGADMLTGLFKGWGESWTATKKAFMTGKNILDPDASVNATSSKALQAWGDATWMQKIAHVPSRTLMAADELFKQLQYRASMRAQILRQARETGVTDPDEIAKRLVEDIQMSFGPNGGVNPKALEYAKTNTFTNELEYGWGKSLQELGERHPWFNFIMPFKRTPTNIFRYVWQRTPLLNQFQKQMVDDIKAGGERAALAHAKTAMGVAIWGTGAAAVASGVVTGRGPTDPALRKQMTDAGWQPYSIRIGNRYVSYRRGDPVATSLGMIADIVQVTGELRDKDQKFYISAAMAAMVSNLSSKTYMQTLTDAMDALASGDENKLSRFVGGLTGSMIPNILRRTDPMVNVKNTPGQGIFEDSKWVFDDNSQSPVREARGFVDGLLSRVPGFSSTLEPHRNIFGEKVMRPPGYLNQALNPFTVSGKVDDDSVQSELIRIGKAFSMPSPTLFGELIDLKDREDFDTEDDGTTHNGQSPYDRLLELMAEPADGSPSLKDAVNTLMKSDSWKAMDGLDQDVHGKGGMKYDRIQDLVSVYHDKSLLQVRNEYKQLGKAYLQAIELEAISKIKGKEGVQDVMKKYESLWKNGKSPVRPQIRWK